MKSRVTSLKILNVLVLALFLFATACAPKEIPTDTPEPVAATATKIKTAGTPTSVPTPTDIPASAFGKVARTHMDYLAGEIGTRMAGSEQEKSAAQYIAGVFQKLGYEVQTQEFTGKDQIDGLEVTTANLIATKPGESKEQIIVGAHYDSSSISKGADDNASGVGVLLELAALLKDRSTPYTIVFVAFGAEEAGLIGSNYYVSQMNSSQVSSTIAMINIDAVGVGNKMYVYSDEGDKAFLRDWSMAWAKKQGYDLLTIENVDLSIDGYGTGDYDAFRNAGIPYFYFEATDWEIGYKDGLAQVDEKYGDGGYIRDTEYDNIEYIDKTFPGRTNLHLKMVSNILYHILTGFTLAK